MLDGNCDVTIELDSDGTTQYTSHDTLTGTVVVDVSDDVTCNGLTLNLGWTTHGRGNTTGLTVISDTLFQGEWKAGETYEYPFEISLPDGPFTYRGHYLNIDWELTANADIPWALDPSDNAEFILKPGSVSHFNLGETTQEEYRQSRPDDDKTISWITLIFGAFLFIGASIFMTVFGLEGQLFALLMASLFWGFGGWMMYTSVKNYFAEKKLGDVDVELSSVRVAPGETVTCQVSLQPTGSVDLNSINLTLKGLERVTSGHGTDKTTYRHPFCKEELVIDDTINRTLDGGSPVEFTQDVSIPESAPFTFDADDNNIIWRIETHIDVPGWPDWEHNERLLVAPGAESGDASQTREASGHQQQQPRSDDAGADSTDRAAEAEFDAEPPTEQTDETPEVKW